MKKTTEVQKMLEYANKQLSRTDEFANRNFKAGICVMIEQILFEANCYFGYMHLTEDSEVGDTGYFSRSYFKPPQWR